MKGVSFKTTYFHKQVVATNMNFYNFVNTVFMPTTFTSLANVLCLTKNPMSFLAGFEPATPSLKVMCSTN